MSPRRAGASVIVVSIGVGTAAGWLYPRPQWAIAAAVMATAATVGMAVGVLWMLRSSWADRTWPPAGPDLPPDVLARRRARVMGIVLLAPLPLAFAGLAWAVAEGSIRWERLVVFAVFVAGYGASGVWFLHSARRGPDGPHPSHSERPTASVVRSQDAGGWRRLGERMRGAFSAAMAGPTVLMMVVIPAQLLLILEDVPWGMAIWAVVVGGMVALGIGWLRRATPQVEVDEGGRRLRSGRRVVSWADVTRAELMAFPPWSGSPRTLVITLADGKGMRAPVTLRRSEALSLTAEETDLLRTIIEASSIELPRDKDDPRGRFSTQLYPNALTKAEAIALVSEPPGMDDPLPIGSTS